MPMPAAKPTARAVDAEAAVIINSIMRFLITHHAKP
jgi:hypothetical protein